MSEQKKKPETTVATLDLGQNCMLTLTTRHLRGQVLRFVMEPGQPPRKIQDQVDVLLSGLSGYSAEEQNMRASRIGTCIGGIICVVLGIALACCGDIAFIGSTLSFMGWIFIVVGVVGAILSKWFPADRATFTLNIMGSKVTIPVAYRQVQECRDFITKLQQAKTEYEEASL